MFLKQEKPEMDDFERRKKFGSKGRISTFYQILWKNVFNGYPLQKFHNILSISFLFWEKKTCIF